MPRRLTFFEQVRGRAPTLVVDGGDFLFGSPGTKAPSKFEELQKTREARRIIEAYDLCGYHAVGLGPADIQFGVDTLRDLLSKARFRVVCANLVEKTTGKAVFAPSTVVEVNGVRFGLYCVMLAELNPVYAERVLGTKYAITDPIEATRKVVAELRKTSDVVIGLSQLDVPDNERVAAQVDGIDFIIDPFARFGTKSVWITADPYIVEKEGQATLVRIDGQGSRVGVLEMGFGEKHRLADHYFYDYPLEPQIFPHPDMVALLARRVTTKEEEPAVKEPRLLTDTFYGRETCGGCHREQLDFWNRTPHATAYASLSADDGFDRSADCVECHTTGYGVFFADLDRARDFAGVQCEGCHGYQAEHPDSPRDHRFGSVSETRCWGCHNPEITQQPFDYAKGRERMACPKMQEK